MLDAGKLRHPSIANLGEHVKASKLCWFLLFPERIPLWCFRHVLPSGILIEYLGPVDVSWEER